MRTSIVVLTSIAAALTGSIRADVSATPGTYTGIIHFDGPFVPDSITVDARDVTNTYTAHADATQGAAGCPAGTAYWCFSIVVESSLANTYYLRPIANISKSSPLFISSRIPFPPAGPFAITAGGTPDVGVIDYLPAEISGSISAYVGSTPLQVKSMYFSANDNSNTFMEPCGGSVEFCPFNSVFNAAAPSLPTTPAYQLFLQPMQDYSYLTQAVRIDEGPLAESTVSFDGTQHIGSLAAGFNSVKDIMLTQSSSVSGTAAFPLPVYNLQMTVSGQTLGGLGYYSTYGTTNSSSLPLGAPAYSVRIFDNADFSQPFSLQPLFTLSSDGQMLLQFPPISLSLSAGQQLTYNFGGAQSASVSGRVTFDPPYPAKLLYPGVQAAMLTPQGGVGLAQTELSTDALGGTYLMPVFPANWSYWRFGWNFDLSKPNFSSNYFIGQFLSIPVQVNNGNVQKDFEFDTALLKVFFTAPAGTSITYPQLDAASGNIVNGNFVADGDVAHAQGLNQNAVQTGEVRMVLRVHDTGPTFRVVPSAVINTNNTPGTGRTDFSPFFITPKKGDVTVVGVPGSLSLTVTSPKDGQTLISCMITVTGTATGAQNISITVNGQPVTTASAANANDPNQVTFSTTIPGAGANTPIVVTASAPNNTSVTSTLHVSATSSTPPVVTASVTTPMLWPPNHDLINVGLSAGATSACDASPGLAVKVYSNEPDLDLGSGNFSPDARNVSTGALRLRSERSGNTISGRVYLVVAAGSDHFGNTGHACTAVTVPFDQSAAGIQAITAQAAAAINTCKGTGSAPNGYVQVGTGPVVGPKQ